MTPDNVKLSGVSSADVHLRERTLTITRSHGLAHQPPVTQKEVSEFTKTRKTVDRGLLKQASNCGRGSKLKPQKIPSLQVEPHDDRV